jgi:type VI secretion system protein ImpH
MAAEDGRKDFDLSEQLLREPQRFDFFQAVRVLEALARERATRDPHHPRAPVGLDEAPEHEHVRFRAVPSLGFPVAPLSSIRSPAGGGPLEALVTFLGLTGPQGALPQHYTTLLLRRLRLKDYALRDFLDLFNHRIVSHFYRAWEKYRLPFAFERAARNGATDPVTQILHCLTGFGTAGLRGRRDSAPAQSILFYAGHFAHFPRSAVALEGLLFEYFGLPVQVEQALGQWLTLDDDDLSTLPDEDCPNGCNNELGISLIVGERVWDVQSKFRVRVGPLHYSQFRQFMPDGDALPALIQLVRTYVGSELDFDVLPILRRDEAPRCQLRSDEKDASRLGWNSWIHDEDYSNDLTDAIFFVETGIMDN